MDVGHPEIAATPPHPVTGPGLEFALSTLENALLVLVSAEP